MTRYCYKMLMFFVITYLQLFNHVYALNILAIVSLPMRSHYMAFQRLFQELALRGHSVTVMNNFPELHAPKNLTFVDMTADGMNRYTIPNMSYYENVDPRYSHLNYFYEHLFVSPAGAKEDCENFFTNKNVKSFHAKKAKYDVIFVEQFRSDCGLAYAAVVYDAPIIGITSHTMLPWAYPRLGIPFDFGADAFYFSQSGPNPSLYNKLESFLMNAVIVNILRWHVQSKIYEVFDKYLPNSKVDIEKAAKDKMRMVFVYQHYSITGPRLLTPQVLEIAGMHISNPKPIPQEIEAFLAGAVNGVIYVSFGSNLKVNTMSTKKFQQFLDAFKKIPQKILWKLDNMTLPAGNENVYAHHWFPQLDVLCHPKVLAFISHGGMLSLSEAAHCGKPLLMIPFFGDQFSNTGSALATGIGIKMHFADINCNNLAAAVKRLTSLEMLNNAQKVFKLWHDRPNDVLESAIYWTEYVARHRTAPSPLPTSYSSWFQYSLIDVYFILGVILLAIIVVTYTIVYILLFLLIIMFRLVNNKDKHE